MSKIEIVRPVGSGLLAPHSPGDPQTVDETVAEATGGSPSVAEDVVSGNGVIPVFHDGFESGDHSHSENGYSWSQTSGQVDSVSEDGAHAKEGEYAARFRQTDEQGNRLIRFNGPALKEFWFSYWIRIPDNYVHPATGNNKWVEFYQTRGELYTISEMWPSGGDSRQTYINNNTGHVTVADPAIVIPQDQGVYRKFGYYLKYTTVDPTTVDVHLKVYHNDVLVFDNENNRRQENTPEEFHEVTNWQIMGFNNAEFSEEITWYVDEVKLFDQDPGWE